ncbi:MAG: hypothetical protein GF353_06290 [Candidatus Lokiarchaeota archaeon]|nr:hypothetical protein [Candidatus Lokiarchaeota archaeon]
MNIKVICPVCRKKGEIEVSETILKNAPRGLVAINIAKGTICSDSFIVYVDKNLNIRDYFTADFQIDLPKLFLEESSEEGMITDEDLTKYGINIDLIKLNISPTILAFILRGVFLGEKIIIVLDNERLIDTLSNFLINSTKKSFKIDMAIVSTEEYENNRKDYKKSLVIGKNELLNDRRKIINPKNIPIERRIVQQFFEELDDKMSLFLIRNEIQKAFEFSNFIAKKLRDKGEEKLDINILNSELQDKYQIKITPVYLKFLFDIVENNFKEKVPTSMKLVLKTIF